MEGKEQNVVDREVGIERLEVRGKDDMSESGRGGEQE